MILLRPHGVRVNGNKYMVINNFFKWHLFSGSIAVANKNKTNIVKTKTNSLLSSNNKPV